MDHVDAQLSHLQPRQWAKWHEGDERREDDGAKGKPLGHCRAETDRPPRCRCLYSLTMSGFISLSRPTSQGQPPWRRPPTSRGWVRRSKGRRLPFGHSDSVAGEVSLRPSWDFLHAPVANNFVPIDEPPWSVVDCGDRFKCPWLPSTRSLAHSWATWRPRYAHPG
jgi:hypothetical protein